jgi:hypothetical protein
MIKTISTRQLFDKAFAAQDDRPENKTCIHQENMSI